MKYYAYIFIFISTVLFFANSGMAQNTVSGSIGLSSILDPTNPVPTVNAKALPASKLEGTPYLFEEFRPRVFEYNYKSFENQVNVDLVSYTLDIIYEGDTVFLPLEKVNLIKGTYDGYEVMISTGLVDEESGSEANTVYLTILKGKYNLHIRKESRLKEPDFDPRFNVGSRNYKLYIKDEVVVSRDGKILRLKNRLKKDKEFYGEDFNKLSEIIEDNDLDYSNLNDLVVLFSEFNALD